MIPNRKIVFIVGAARSGTTWLQFLMQQSPQVASTSNETHLFDTYIKPLVTTWNASEGRTTGIRRLLSDDEFSNWLTAFVEMCIQRIAGTKAGARLIVEKTPPHCTCGPAILRCLPDSYFIHIMRDPRAAVTSMRAAADTWGAHWAPRRLVDACRKWSDWIAQARSIAALTPRYREVSYERLHAETPDELMRLFAWLGEPIGRKQAEAFVAACDLDSLREVATTGEASGKIPEPAQFFRRGEVDSWRTELAPTEIAIVERLTKKQMALLGYEPVSGRRERLAAKARLRAY